jgi:hypothetical protein
LRRLLSELTSPHGTRGRCHARVRAGINHRQEPRHVCRVCSKPPGRSPFGRGRRPGQLSSFRRAATPTRTRQRSLGFIGSCEGRLSTCIGNKAPGVELWSGSKRNFPKPRTRTRRRSSASAFTLSPFHRLLPLVPEQYRALRDEVDLQGKDPDAVSARLGVTRNNLTVRLHRARKHLRKALTANCGACSVHGCVDCTCNDAEEKSPCH